jgi:flagellar biogenesis protein FliO
MDGPMKLPVTYCAVLAAIFVIGALPPDVRGQAMGKAAVEGAPAVVSSAVVAPPAVPTSPAPSATPSTAELALRNLINVTQAPPVAPQPSSPVSVVFEKPAVQAAPNEEPKADVPAAPRSAAVPVSVTPAASSIEQAAIRRDEPSKSADGTTPARSTSLLPGMGSFVQVVAALAIVIGLIFIGRALMRKFVPGAKVTNGKGVIEILARHPLTKNQSIVLIRIGSQIVALNQGKESSESVLVINDATEVARIIGQIEGKNPNSMQAGFNNLLANARMDLEENADAANEQKTIDPEGLDEQLEEMAAAKRQLMELRQHVRSVRDRIPSA